MTFILKRLSETHLFQIHEKKLNISAGLKKINFNSEVINPKQIEEQLTTILKKYTMYTCRNQVIDAYMKEKIYLIYPADNSLSKLIPVFLMVHPIKKEIISAINIRPYSILSRDNLQIEAKKLYAFLETAFIDRKLYLDELKFTLNSKVMLYSTQIYTKLMNKVFDKLYGINLNPILTDQVLYLLGKFFLLNIIQKPQTDIVDNIAYNCIFNGTSKEKIFLLNNEFDNTYYQSLPKFFEGLKSFFVYFGSLDLRLFLENFMIMFGSTSVMSIEYYPSMIENCFHAIIFGSKINRDFIFESVVGKETAKLHSEIIRLII